MTCVFRQSVCFMLLGVRLQGSIVFLTGVTDLRIFFESESTASVRKDGKLIRVQI